ncbi:AI-2E family transporter [Labrys okinawensis]|uniref:AI-2E family transporter n=1 Tax=Labrys okinawensis TaxID=346911 RepID=A0A2S9QJY8_9HYPH|nr:AI-2E family transporter [Labrys okinawensis]PRH89651.1 AI-2E family transporter [Labrys okinawensis]
MDVSKNSVSKEIDHASPQTRCSSGELAAASPHPLISPAILARGLLLLVLAAAIYFFHGFLVPVLAALVIAFASWPIYRKLRAALGGRDTLSAAFAIILILAFLIVPIVLAGSYASNEIRDSYAWLMQINRDGAAAPVQLRTVPFAGAWIEEQWNRYLGHPGGIGEVVQLLSGDNIGNVYRGVLAAGAGIFGFALNILFMMIALLFLYRDGDRLVAKVETIGHHLFPQRWKRVSRVIPATIASTVTGMTLIAFGEGIVLGVAYWFAGAPSPATLGVITGIMALIPGGAPLCFTLVSIYLTVSGSPVAGVALLSWGSIELFVVDKTIRPKLVGGPIELPFLPTFFGLVGGIKTMGFLGLFLGPVLMALLFAIWREWTSSMERS